MSCCAFRSCGGGPLCLSELGQRVQRPCAGGDFEELEEGPGSSVGRECGTRRAGLESCSL